MGLFWSYHFSLSLSSWVDARFSERLTKVVVLGDVNVGKSSLIQRFVKNSFSNDYKATIGVDFEVEKFFIIGKSFNLQIWDTAGQERFRCIAAGKLKLFRSPSSLEAKAYLLAFQRITEAPRPSYWHLTWTKKSRFSTPRSGSRMPWRFARSAISSLNCLSSSSWDSKKTCL